MKIILLCVALTLSRGAAAQDDESAKIHVHEIQTVLQGDWLLRLEYQPSEKLTQGKVTSGEERWYAGPGGTSLIEEFRESVPSGEVTGLGILWWNQQLKAYQVLWCDSENPSGCSLLNGTGTWQDGRFTIVAEQQQAGKKFALKEVFSDFSPNSFKQCLYSGQTVDAMKLDVVIAASRKSAAGKITSPVDSAKP